jgi:hypothetical protein
VLCKIGPFFARSQCDGQWYIKNNAYSAHIVLIQEWIIRLLIYFSSRAYPLLFRASNFVCQHGFCTLSYLYNHGRNGLTTAGSTSRCTDVASKTHYS